MHEDVCVCVCVWLIHSSILKGIFFFKHESEKCFSLTCVLALVRRGPLSKDLYKLAY